MRGVTRTALQAAGPALTGAYASLEDLLALRHLRPQPLPRRAKGRRIGMHESRRKGRGIDLDEVREYQPGDDARYIDWARHRAQGTRPHPRLSRGTRVADVDRRGPNPLNVLRQRRTAEVRRRRGGGSPHRVASA